MTTGDRLPPRPRSAGALALALVAVVGLAPMLVACSGSGRSAAPSSSLTTSVANTIDAAYRAGFRTERQLVAVTAIAIAESSLRTKTRNWHPEYGYRPKGDVLGVTGDRSVMSADGRQLHSDRGIWQISSHWWPQYTDAACDDPVRAARIAFTISSSGTDFSPWDAHKSGAAARHYDQRHDGWPAVRPAVRDYLSRR